MGRFFTLLFLILIIGGAVYIYPQVEWHSPGINIKLDSDDVGIKPFDVVVSDKGKGLKNVSIVLVNESGETVILNKDYPEGVKADTDEHTSELQSQSNLL